MDAAAYAIRAARRDEIEKLPSIERAAATRFAGQDMGSFSLDDVCDLATHEAAQKEGMLWVATQGDEPVGFAIASRIAGVPHLLELDVHPDHGRRGLGARLVAAVVAWARAEGASFLTLSTFRDVAWNAPFYAQLGFRALDETELDEPHRALLDHEEEMGLPRHRRVVMRLALAGDAEDAGDDRHAGDAGDAEGDRHAGDARDARDAGDARAPRADSRRAIP